MTTPDSIVKNPLIGGVMVFLLGLTGSMVKDRLMTEGRDSATAAQVTALDSRFKEHLTDAVSRQDYLRVVASLEAANDKALTKEQFLQFERENAKRLDDIASDLRDIRAGLLGVHRVSR